MNSPPRERGTSGTEFVMLGLLEMSVGGRVVKLGGATPRALLAMFLLRLNEAAGVDALATGLWGERVPPSATNSLHSHISRLRRLMDTAGDDRFRIERRGAAYALCGDPERVDARKFERLVAEGRELVAAGGRGPGAAHLRAALGLWRGPALVEFAGAEFARGEAVRLDELHIAANVEVIDAELALGAHATLVPELERLVDIHPLQERFWGQLMLALYRAGRQGDALETYRRVHRLLGSELGVAPGPALQRVHHLILRHDDEVAAPPGQRSVAPSVSVPRIRRGPLLSDVFVGRAEELSLLREALAQAATGRGAAVIVEAGPGFGKTALVERFAAEAEAAGAAVCFGRAWEDEGAPPFWPWVQVLRGRAAQFGYAPDPASVELSDLLPDLLPDQRPRRPVEATPERARLFEAVALRLIDPGTAPVVVVLEDLHGVDEPSLHLLHFVSRAVRRARCLIILTHRPLASQAAATAPLTELSRELGCRRITLRPLADPEVHAYLDAALGPELPAELVTTVTRRAEGHPLFLTEIVRVLADHLRSGQVDGVALDLTELPRNVTEVIGRRLAALGDDAVRTLMSAAVLGREFDLRLLSEVLTVDVDVVLDRIEEAAGAGLVEELPGGSLGYRFDHALTQEALYAHQSGPRRVLLHARIADAIEAGHGGPAQTRRSELARHRCASVSEGGLDAAIDSAVAAAEAAAAQFAYEEAARLYRLALDTRHEHGADCAGDGRLLLALGDSWQRAGQPERARGNFVAAAQLARDHGDARLLAAAALGLGGAFEARAYDGELVELLQEAIGALAPEQRALRSRLLARLSMALHLNDPLERGQQLSAEALELARGSGDPALQAQCTSARFFALWGPGHSAERLQCAEETLRLAEGLGDPDLALDALAWTICEVTERGDRPALERRLAEHAQLAQSVQHPLHRYYVLMWRAMLAAVDGRGAEAIELALGAAAVGEALTDMALPRRTALLYAVRRDLGGLEEFVTTVEEIAARFPLLWPWRIAAARMRIDLGEPAPAQQLLTELPADVTAVYPRDGNWILGIVMLAELVVALADRDRAAALYPLLEPHRDRLVIIRFAVFCLGSMDRTLGQLAATCHDWPTAQEHFEVALTADRSFGARASLIRTQCAYADMLRRRGEPGDEERASQLVDAAHDAAQELGLLGLIELCRNTAGG